MSGISRGTDAFRAVKLAVEECHELLTLPRANELSQVAFAGFIAVLMELLEHGVGKRHPGVAHTRASRKPPPSPSCLAGAKTRATLR